MLTSINIIMTFATPDNISAAHTVQLVITTTPIKKIRAVTTVKMIIPAKTAKSVTLRCTG